MKANVGGIDRLARILIGLVLLGAGYVYGSPWGLVGLIPLLTAVVRFCPLYPLVGLNTCPLEKPERKP